MKITFGGFFRITPATIMRCGPTFRLARTRPTHARSSGLETSLRSRSLADYTIDTHESEFSEATGASSVRDRRSRVPLQTGCSLASGPAKPPVHRRRTGDLAPSTSSSRAAALAERLRACQGRLAGAACARCPKVSEDATLRKPTTGIPGCAPDQPAKIAHRERVSADSRSAVLGLR